MKKFYIIAMCVFIMISNAASLCCYADDGDSDITFKDYSGVISDSAKEYINKKNEKLFDVAKAKIIFITVDSTNGLSAQEYCEQMYSELGLKSYGRCNSVLGVVAPKKRDYGFVQGSNISLTLTDAMLDEFIVKNFEPDFRKKQYDEAVLKMFNALAGWYENEYTSLSLNLDENIQNYTDGNITKDVMKNPKRIMMWIGIGVGLILFIVIMKIKRNIDLQIRQHERRKLKKKYKIDLDKVVNS